MSRLVLTQKGHDLIRTAASLTAYAVIGVAGTAGIWAALSLVILVAKG